MMLPEYWTEGAWLLLLWTVPALLLLLSVQRVVRRWPEAAYALLQAGFYALPLGLLAYGMRLAWLPEVSLWRPEAPAVLTWVGLQVVQVSAEVGGRQGVGVGWIMGIVWGLGVTVRLVVLGGRWVRLRRYLRQCRPASPALQAELAGMAFRLGIRRTIRLLVGGTIPFSMGGRRPTIVVPEMVLDNPQMRRPMLWHELVHLQRRDFRAQLFEEGVLTLLWFHPLLWGYRRRLELLREVLCDRAVLAQRITSPASYARLLLTVLWQAQRAPALKLSLSLSRRSTLKQRMEAMMHPTQSLTPRHVRLMLIGILIGLTGMMACTEMPETPVQSQTEATTAAKTANKVLETPEELQGVVMPEVIGGIQTLYEKIQYPEAARAQGIEGKVIVRFVVDETGEVREAQIIRGVHEALDQAVLQAVQTLRFKPAQKDGLPVAVRMTLPVVFQLGEQDGR
ncbi:MAG: M56 family metallopeptidase [Rhodothermus sp.]|nr:M56 family metallopeptidase [Rhodothermus sp.]